MSDVIHPNQIEGEEILEQARSLMRDWEQNGVSVMDVAILIRTERERAAEIVEQAGRDYGGLEAATACEEAAATIRYAFSKSPP